MKSFILSLLLFLGYNKPESFTPGATAHASSSLNCSVDSRDGKTISSDRNGNILARLHRIHISGDTLFFPISLFNRSQLRYEVDFIRFYLRDRKVAKRTVTQELEIVPFTPAALAGTSILSKGKCSLVFAFPRFSLAKGKELGIEIFEKQGGRHLHLKIRKGALENAKPYPL